MIVASSCLLVKPVGKVMIGIALLQAMNIFFRFTDLGKGEVLTAITVSKLGQHSKVMNNNKRDMDESFGPFCKCCGHFNDKVPIKVA